MKILTPFKRIAAPNHPELDALLKTQYDIGFMDGFVSASLIIITSLAVATALTSTKK
jgi:hypothetical protein